MEYGLIGEHLQHSYSPEIHRILAQMDVFCEAASAQMKGSQATAGSQSRMQPEESGAYSYELCELAEAELSAFFATRDFQGINVTLPYKQTVVPLLDKVDEAAERIGAVNCVVNFDGALTGYNTDFDGMLALLEHEGVAFEGRKVLILGTGGTSRTARAVAQHLGAKDVVLVSRNPQAYAQADANYDANYDATPVVSYSDACQLHADADVIINTTPCGMWPHIDQQPINLDAFTNLKAVVDAVYNPRETALVRDARSRGITACGGWYMLIAQAVLSAKLFFQNGLATLNNRKENAPASSDDLNSQIRPASSGNLNPQIRPASFDNLDSQVRIASSSDLNSQNTTVPLNYQQQDMYETCASADTRALIAQVVRIMEEQEGQ